MTEYPVKYLGDGVYASYDGYQIILMTGSHIDPDSIIYLDDNVLAALAEYVKQLQAQS